MVRCRGGSKKYRGLRLDSGNFSWGSMGKKSRRINNLVFAQCEYLSGFATCSSARWLGAEDILYVIL